MTWQAMKRRCENLRQKNFSSYGAVGIKVCERWQIFENFLEDMGECPVGRSIDRIDNERGYEPSNCRWSTLHEQARNKRRSLCYVAACLLRHQHRQGYTQRALAKRFEISRDVVSRIIHKRSWHDKWATQHFGQSPSP